MPITQFSPNTIVTSAVMNAILNPVYRENPQNDGEIKSPTNADLSQAPGQIVPEWTEYKEALQVTSAGGALVQWEAGNVSDAAGQPVSIAAGNLALPDGHSFIYVNSAMAVTAGPARPIRGLPLAEVTIAGGVVSGAIVDLRPRYEVRPRPDIISVFGSDGYEGDFTLAAGQVATRNGVLRVADFTIAAGATLNATPGYLYVYASGDVVIDGTITVTPLISGGQAFSGSMPTQQHLGSRGFGFGGGGGHNTLAPLPYSCLASDTSSGGASGFTWNQGNTADITTSGGGTGGGTLIIEAAGTITITGTINASGQAAPAGLVGAAPTNGGALFLAGGGGGSGGLVWFRSARGITASPAAIINARGGAGGAAASANLVGVSALGGGGGGGGWIGFSSPNNQTTGSTLNLPGGAAGATSGAGPAVAGSPGGSYGGRGGASGQPGSVGSILLQQYIPV